MRVKGQRVKDKLVMIKKLLQYYSDKIQDHFVIITNKKIRFIPMEDI